MYDIYGLGNALVDTEFLVEDSFLTEHSIPKGHMTLVEEDVIIGLSDALDHLPPKRMSGGSAANSIYAAQALGSSTFYSCKVADDSTGNHFLEDLTSAGVAVNGNARADEGISGKCLILITPDAERSMNTFLGISTELSEREIDEAALANAKYFYVEGYLSSNHNSMEAAIACRELAERNKVATAVSLSDPSMVEFFRDNLAKILGNGVDYIFCNEEEALTWANTDRLDVAIAELKDIARHCSITLGARGSLSVDDGVAAEVEGFKVNAIDTNGAGDIFAGTFLSLRAGGADAKAATHFANFAASQLVTTIGARFADPHTYQELRSKFPG